MHAETERLTASDAHLLLNISDRLLDQVNEVRGAELSQCVQRLGTGLDCGVQLLLEDPIVVPVSLLPITGDCDGSIGVMEGVRGERGSARCGEDVLFFFSRMLLRRGKTPGSLHVDVAYSGTAGAVTMAQTGLCGAEEGTRVRMRDCRQHATAVEARPGRTGEAGAWAWARVTVVSFLMQDKMRRFGGAPSMWLCLPNALRT